MSAGMLARFYDALRSAERERPAAESRAEENGRVEPAVPILSGRPAGGDGASGAQAPGPRADGRARRPPPALAAVSAPSSPAAAQLGALRSRLVCRFAAGDRRSLLVTSPGRADGKSTIAANLGLLLAAEIDKRVLLVDGDLRQPALHRLFGVPRTRGLSDAALGRVAWATAVVDTPWNQLRLLPAGSQVPNPAELLGGPGARALFGELRRAFDYVVIDTAPVLPVADATVLAGMSDAVLLVTRSERTPRAALAEAMEALSRAPLLGLVLNAVPDGLFSPPGYSVY